TWSWSRGWSARGSSPFGPICASPPRPWAQRWVNHDRADGVRPPARLDEEGSCVAPGESTHSWTSATRRQRNAERSESERNPVNPGRIVTHLTSHHVRHFRGPAWLSVVDETIRH